MDKATEDQLTKSHPLLRRIVDPLKQAGVSTDEAWLSAGAIEAYTSVSGISPDILTGTGKAHDEYPKVVGTINKALRGEAKWTDAHTNLLALMKNIELLPEYFVAGQDPTRMMTWYSQLETHYREGNVLLMAEVGSVCRHRPAPGLYQWKYRVHISGGLKDISFLNPAQQEVIYAPGTPYLVKARRTGKVKEKKGNQAHEHIYLEYAPHRRRDAINLSAVHVD
jgi:hypothetical protein